MSFYPAPQVIEARVWVDLAGELGWTPGMTPMIEKFVGKPAHSFLEGPSFDRTGNLYVVDFAFGRIVRVSPEGRPEVVCEYHGAPNGLQVGADGMVYVTDRMLGMMRLDPASGAIDLHLGPDGAPGGFDGLSDLTIGRGGDIFFTDQGDSHLLAPTGRVLRLRPDGRCDVVMEGIPGPNGIVLSPDEAHVFVAVTYGPAIWRGRVRPDGPADKVGVFQSLPGGYSGTDGLAVDIRGGIAACHNRLGTVWLLDHDGAPTHRVVTPPGHGRKITNVVYGGPGEATLYMTETETGTLLVADGPVPGRRTVGQDGAHDGK